MVDYAANQATAKRLVDGAGRDVTLIQLDYDAQDDSKPWRGVSDPRATPARSLGLKAAFLPLAGNVQLGLSKATMDLVKTADATCLIGTSEDLSPFQELQDSKGGVRFKIVGLEVLAPGPVNILTFLVLKE
jgi:hypothetical protein